MEQLAEEQYYNEPVKSDEIYANVLQEERVKNILGQTSPDNQLTDIEWRIRGYRKDNLSGQWVKIAEGTAEPDSLLVGRYISFLSSILSDNTRFTNLSSSEINKVMKLCIEYLTDDLDSHAKDYGLENDYSERTRIGLIILNSTFFILKRAENGMESRRIWSALNLVEQNMPMQKKSMWDNLKFWK